MTNLLPTSVIKLDLIGPDDELNRSHVRHLELIFDVLPDVYFYVKGKTGRWVSCNISTVRLLKFPKRDDVLGAREEDFFPKSIAERIYKDDMQVVNSAKPLLNRIELILEEKKHSMVWATTTKLPVVNRDGVVVGLMGITRQLAETDALPGPFEAFRVVVDYIQNNIRSAIKVEELSQLAKLSPNQFRKRFREQFGLTTQEFILRTRLRAASHMLTSSDRPISDITYEAGFVDQSYFTRQFKRFFGETPLRHRQRWNPNSRRES